MKLLSITKTEQRRAQVRKSVALWKKRNPDRHKELQQNWYRKNRETILAQKKRDYRGKIRKQRIAYSRKYYAANRKQACATMRRRLSEIKDLVFAAYGGYKCACCKERNKGFLTIDHIDGCTRNQRRLEGLGSTFYRYLFKHQFPPGYQVLCYNCNLGRAKNGGICPHRS